MRFLPQKKQKRSDQKIFQGNQYIAISNTILTESPFQAGEMIQSGGVVVFPTETVYGIGASSYNHQSCKKIYTIKNRPPDNPLIVHVADFSEMEKISYINSSYIEIIKSIKNSVTFIFKKKDSAIFSSDLDTIAVRVPTMKITLDMLKISGPVSAPSANVSGKPSITCYEDAKRIFNGKVDAILKGPDSTIGLESAIIDLTQEVPIYLRPGSFSIQEAKKYFSNIKNYFESTSEAFSVTPGMKYRHYAPEGNVFLVNSSEDFHGKENFAYIGFRDIPNCHLQIPVKDNIEYMHALFRFFNQCDFEKIEFIYCEMPLDDELRMALLNRIQKATKKNEL